MNAAAPGANARALAAQALQRIVAGQSLRAEFAAFSTKLHDARDRALLSALLREGARWWLRYSVATGRLLERPLPAREAQLQALLVLGLVQIEVLQLPGYAAVDATVEATRALGNPKVAALANALLRRWQRSTQCVARCRRCCAHGAPALAARCVGARLARRRRRNRHGRQHRSAVMAARESAPHRSRGIDAAV
jgi:hypothetical protein